MCKLHAEYPGNCPAGGKENALTRMVFVRHGQSEANVSGVFAGQTDVPLSPLGRKQACELKEFLAEHYKIDAVYSSDMSRAYDTVLPAAEAFGLTIRKDISLREIDGGLWEGREIEEIARAYPEEYALWRSDTGLSRCTGGESMRELQERGIAGTERIAGRHRGQTVLLATHAGFLRAMQCYWEGRPLEEMKDIPWVPNASVTEVEYRSGKPRIVRLGEVSFLHGDLTTLRGSI
mgnify:CR=1 FL=1